MTGLGIVDNIINVAEVVLFIDRGQVLNAAREAYRQDAHRGSAKNFEKKKNLEVFSNGTVHSIYDDLFLQGYRSNQI